MAQHQYRLSLKSTYNESEKVPEFVEDIQSKSGLEEEPVGKLMLLLSEAVTNAIVHGNKENPDKNVEVEVTIEPDVIVSTVTDEGEGFNPTQDVPDPLAEENLLKDSGRGVFLINEISDSVQYFDQGRGIKFKINR